MRHSFVARGALSICAGLTAIVGWWLWQPEPPPVAAGDPSRNPTAEASPARGGVQEPPRTAAAVEELEREAAADRPAASEPLPLRIRLRGLRADLPWNGLVQVDLDGPQGHFAANLPGACGGVAQFDVPGPLAADPATRTWVTGSARYYHAVEVRHQGPLDLTQELVLDVSARARITGRVTGPQGEDVFARVVAFAMREGRPSDEVLDTSPTLLGSGFELQVPADTPVLVVAAASDRDPLSGIWYSTPDALRDDLLVQGRPVTATFDHDTDLGTIVLPAAELLQGRVVHADGTPARGVLVTAGQPGLASLPVLTGYGDDTLSRASWDGTATLLPETFSYTGGDGRFTLPTRPGVAVQVRATGLSDRYQRKNPELRLYWVHPGLVVRTTSRWVELRLPPLQLVRVLDAGRPVQGAMVEVGAGEANGATSELCPTNADGELQLVMADAPVRAAYGGRRSAWRSPTADRRPLVLDLDESLGELRLDLGPAGLGPFAHLAWRRGDDRGEQDLIRARVEDPFACSLPLGRVRLRITASDWGPAWLLPIDTEVEITSAAQTLTLAAHDGGRVVVFVQDAGGRHVPGRCRMLDEHGADVALRFAVRDFLGKAIAEGQPGELLPQGPNTGAELLPPGSYTLLIEAGGHTFERQSVTITARAATEVHLRMP